MSDVACPITFLAFLIFIDGHGIGKACQPVRFVCFATTVVGFNSKRTKTTCLINDHFNFTYLTDRIIMLQLTFFVLRSYREIYINSPKTFGFFKVNHFHFFLIMISQL